MFHIKNFSFYYPNKSKRSLDNIDLVFNEGEIILIVGPNGGGKTTLLKSLMGIVPFMTGGNSEGNITYCEKSISSYTISKLAGKIGFALQEPENQVTNLTVWEEVIFGPLNLKHEQEKIITDAHESLKAVGLLDKINVSVLSLSAGQLQRLSLASLLSMKPSVLIVDEPISNLDPHGVYSVVSILKFIKKYVKLMIISAHWIDPFINLANRMVIIDKGRVVFNKNISDLYNHLDILTDHRIEIPQKYKIIKKLEKIGIKNYVLENIKRNNKLAIKVKINEERLPKDKLLFEVKNVSFAYENKKSIFEKISLKLNESEQAVLAGRNGAGKTTLARIISGLLKPSDGTISYPKGKISLLMQKPTLGFMGRTVLEEVLFGTKMKEVEAEEWLDKFGIGHLAGVSPFRISGGEQRRLALAVVFSQNPQLIILDEPTSNLDSIQVKKLLKNLEDFKGAVLHISHDIRMVENCSRIIILGEKNIMYDGHRKLITPETVKYLGYDLVNSTVELALALGSSEIPLQPEEMEISNENFI